MALSVTYCSKNATYRKYNSFDVCEENGQVYVLYKKALTGQAIYLNFSGYNVIFLYPLVAQKLVIKAISVIALAHLSAKEGAITATDRVISLTGQDLSSMVTTIEAPEVTSLQLEAASAIVRDFQERIAEQDPVGVFDALDNMYYTVASVKNAPSTSYEAGDITDSCTLNGAQFVIYKEDIVQEEAYLDFSGSTLIFLRPLSVQKELTIKAHAVIALADIAAETLSIEASTHVISLRGQELPTENSFSITPESERWEMIFHEFQEGIENKDAEKIYEGLLDIFDAVTDPGGIRPCFELSEAFTFLGIPESV